MIKKEYFYMKFIYQLLVWVYCLSIIPLQAAPVTTVATSTSSSPVEKNSTTTATSNKTVTSNTTTNNTSAAPTQANSTQTPAANNTTEVKSTPAPQPLTNAPTNTTPTTTSTPTSTTTNTQPSETNTPAANTDASSSTSSTTTSSSSSTSNSNSSSSTTPTPASSPSTPSAATTTPAVPQQEKPKAKVLTSMYIQNNYDQDAVLKEIEFGLANNNNSLKKELNIKVPANKNLYSKGSVTAFDLTTSNDVETFNGISSITIDNDHLTFKNAQIGFSLNRPIRITKKDGHWVLNA